MDRKRPAALKRKRGKEADPGPAAGAGIPVTPGSGNVFADPGVAEPEEELTRARLASHIPAATVRQAAGPEPAMRTRLAL
jgi:hypothetical protein